MIFVVPTRPIRRSPRRRALEAVEPVRQQFPTDAVLAQSLAVLKGGGQ
jgi:hypothetical protein